MAVEHSKLAIHGGAPVRTKPFPSALHGIQEVGQEEKDAVMSVLERQKIFRFLSSEEESFAARFEAAYREYTGCSYALAVTGGTTALVSCLAGLQIGTGDEVIVPAYTYIATAAAVLLVGAIPVIAEVDDTLTLDPVDVEKKITPLTKAVIPVHMRGLPAQMDEIMAIARKHELHVIEDVAQANGGAYKGRKLGSIGDAGAFSFQHYKVITSGEGGMVVTNDPGVFQRAAFRHDSALSFWLKDDLADAKPTPGTNARMCELRAAVGLTQFQRLQGIIDKTRSLKRRIIEGLTGCPGITLQRVSDPEGDCGISVGFYLPTAEAAKQFQKALAAEGIPAGTIYNQGVPDRHIYKHWDYVMNKYSNDPQGYPWAPQFYKGNVEYSPDMCPQSLDYLGRIIMISLSQRFTEQDADDIVEAVWKVAQNL